jgi:methionyl-tRNA synthetase
VEDSKPWNLAKDGSPELAGVMYNLLEMIRVIALMLLPFIPDSSAKILSVYAMNSSEKAFVWSGQREFGLLKSGQQLGELAILFPRLEEPKAV